MYRKKIKNFNINEILFYILFFGIYTIILYLPVLKMNNIPITDVGDQIFIVNRIKSLIIALENGHLFPANGISTFWKYGLGVNTFYPYLFLYPIAILKVFTKLSFIHSYYICITVYAWLGFIITYFCTYKIIKNKFSAILCALIYNTGTFYLLQPLMRNDLGRFVALIFLPVAFLGLYELFENKNSKNWIFLSLGMALVFYAHVLSILLFSIMFAIFCILNYKKFDFQVFKRILISVFLCILLVLPFVLPMFINSLHSKITAPYFPTNTPSQTGLNFMKLLSNSLNNIVPHSNYHTFGVGLMIIVSYLILLINIRKLNNFESSLLFMGTLGLLMATNLFPWYLFEHTPITVIQFAWRFLGGAGFYIALACCDLLAHLNLQKFLYISLIGLTSIVALPIVYNYAHWTFSQVINEQYYEKLSGNNIQRIRLADYMPKLCFDNQNSIIDHIAYLNGKSIKLSNNQITNPSYNQIAITFNNLQKGKKYKADLPIVNYNYDRKNYQLSKRGTILINFIAKSHRQTIIYTQNVPYPSFWTIIIAIITLIICISYLLI